MDKRVIKVSKKPELYVRGNPNTKHGDTFFGFSIKDLSRVMEEIVIEICDSNYEAQKTKKIL